MKNEKYYFNMEKYNTKIENNRIILISKMDFSIVVLNKTGYQILSLMDGKKSNEEIIASIIEQYDIKEDIVRDYSNKFIDNMVEKKLIILAEKYKDEIYHQQSLNRVYLNLSENNIEGNLLFFEKLRSIMAKIEENEHENKIRFFVKLGSESPNSVVKKIIKYLGGKKFVKLFLFSDGCCFKNELLTELNKYIDTMVLNLSSYNKNDDLLSVTKKYRLCKQYNLHILVNILLRDDNLDSCLAIQQDLYDIGINGMFVDDEKIGNKIAYNIFMDKLYMKNNFLNSWRNNRLRDNSKRFYVLTEKELCLKCFYPHKSKVHCGIGIEEIFIDSIGNIYPCHRALEDKFQSIDDYYLKREEMYGLKLKPKKCKNCNGWCLCLSGCKMKNIDNGKKLEETPENCEVLVKKIEEYYAKL